MKRFQSYFTIMAFFLTFSFSAFAGEQCERPAEESSAELNMIKALAGKWVTTSDMFGKKQKLYVEYKVTAGGAAVLETIFPNTPYEMLSVYYDENGKMELTHYCMMKNRPSMKVVKSTSNSLTLKVTKIAGPKTKGASMGEATYTFKDKNHMSQSCSNKDEKGVSHPITLEYTRVK